MHALSKHLDQSVIDAALCLWPPLHAIENAEAEQIECHCAAISHRAEPLPPPDSGSPLPTAGAITKKAKSRPMDKDGRNKNRLSHTSTPLYFAKSRRPLPSDQEETGAPNRVPGGQPSPRRQRSVHTQGR